MVNETRRKIMDSAVRLFAEKGYMEVTVREIANNSGTNISAMNYHFQDKESLYRAVLKEACEITMLPADKQDELLKLEPAEALTELNREILLDYTTDTDSHWYTLLISRESRNPSPVFKEVVVEYLKPQADFFGKLIGNDSRTSGDENSIQFSVTLMMGLLELFGFYRHVIDAVSPGLMDKMQESGELYRRITELTLFAAGKGK